MSVKYVERTTGAQAMSTEMDALADNRVAVATSALSNDVSTERNLRADFLLYLDTQGGARDASAQVSLLILPEVNSTYPEVAGADATADLVLSAGYIAKDADGNDCTRTLDAAVTARNVVFAGVQLPNANYKPAILQETNQALAATSNTLWKSGDYTVDDV